MPFSKNDSSPQGIGALSKEEANSLKQLIASGKTGEAIHSLMTEARSEGLYNKAIIISSDFQNLENRRVRGVITSEDYTVHQNIISENLLKAH